MEKKVLVEAPVEDLWGLYADLRRASFMVKNVAYDHRGTYVYMDPSEEKDPTSIVQSWSGKKAPYPSIMLRDIRIKELKRIEEQENKKIQEKLAQNGSDHIVENENKINAGFSLRKGFFRKVLGKFF